MKRMLAEGSEGSEGSEGLFETLVQPFSTDGSG
jgi:hypothetical protein